MSYSEAVGWLLQHGGRWSVRASQAACFVVVTVDGVNLTVPTTGLTPLGVDDALVSAIERLRSTDKHP